MIKHIVTAIMTMFTAAFSKYIQKIYIYIHNILYCIILDQRPSRIRRRRVNYTAHNNIIITWRRSYRNIIIIIIIICAICGKHKTKRIYYYYYYCNMTRLWAGLRWMCARAVWFLIFFACAHSNPANS